MNNYENEKFERFGSSFFLLLLGLGVGLPFVLSLILCIPDEEFKLSTFLPLGIVFMFIAWIIMLIMIAYGYLTSYFVKRTGKKIDALPYKFNSFFKSRGGTRKRAPVISRSPFSFIHYSLFHIDF